MQAREVADDQLAVLQLTTSSLALGLMLNVAKSRPEIVVDVPIDTAAFVGPADEMTGASNETLSA